MIKKVFRLLLVAAIFYAPQQASAVGKSQADHDKIIRAKINESRESYFKLKNDIDSSSYHNCKRKVDVDAAKFIVSAHQHLIEILSPDAQKLSDFQEVAQMLNEVAGLYEKIGCAAKARETYLFVIETFIGIGYSAMRQRAQIGIDDLRASSQARPSAAGPDDLDARLKSSGP